MYNVDIYHGELVGAEVWSEAVCPQQELLPHQLGVDVLCGLDHALQYSTEQYSTVQYRTVQYSTVIHSMWVVAALLVAGLVSRLQALLLARVTVPPFGLGGAAASLGCEYDPQGDAVYSVKWYKVSSRLVPGC